MHMHTHTSGIDLRSSHSLQFPFTIVPADEGDQKECRDGGYEACVEEREGDTQEPGAQTEVHYEEESQEDVYSLWTILRLSGERARQSHCAF